MIKKTFIVLFWLAFFGYFFWLFIPKSIDFINNGFPGYMGDTWMNRKLLFFLHICFGTIVYVSGLIQFTPYIRNNYIRFHRMLGKVYILSSLVCVSTLYIMIPDGLCAPCRFSHYIVTSLWLIFVLLAYYFIRQRKIVWHQRLMISSYICAAYFVTVRVVDKYAMKVFHYLFPNESAALLASDIFVWFVPLTIFWMYWIIRDSSKKTISLEDNKKAGYS